MLFDPFLEFLSGSLTGGYSKDLGFGVVDVGHKFEAIQHENSFRRGVANSLVPVDERMIHDKGKAQCGGLGRKGRIQILTTEGLTRLA